MIKRRTFLGGMAAITINQLLHGRAIAQQRPLFAHGVASGDPLPHAVIIWTRVSGISMATTVGYTVALDPGFTDIVVRGSALAHPDADFTVKVDVDGLQPGTPYYYRFHIVEVVSPVGRTRTAPAGEVEALRFGVASCAKYSEGYYHAYAALAAHDDLNAVIHLGDYIYESRADASNSLPGREHVPPTEAVTLADYRARYAQYRSDPDLQALHQRHPMIAVWDDHEFTDNAHVDGAANHNPATEGDWHVRKLAAAQAYHEWMPIRSPHPTNPLQIYRAFAFGDLADLMMLDTRIIGRDAQLPHDATRAQLDAPTRELLGPPQRAWLQQHLRQSTAQWRLIGNQVLMAPVIFGPAGRDEVSEPDVWDGYRAEQMNFVKFLHDHDIQNTVVLTGDLHSAAANDLPLDVERYDPATARNAVAVEVVTPPISSDTQPDLQPLEARLKALNPHLKFIDFRYKGYLLVEINSTRFDAKFFLLNDANRPETQVNLAQHWYTESGESYLQPTAVSSQPT